MKMNLLVKIRTTAFSFLFGLTLQVLTINTLVALETPEDTIFQDVKIKMHGEKSTLEQAFQIIEQQTSFRFFYIKEDVPLNTHIKARYQEESLNQILQNLAKEFGLSFSRVNNQIVVKKKRYNST
jgi:hypothetical protein